MRTGGAQDSKHTTKLFDVILSWEKGGPVQQLPQDAAHSPAGTEAKHLRDHTRGTQVSPHQHPHFPLWSRNPQSSLQIPSFTQSKASSLEYRAHQPSLGNVSEPHTLGHTATPSHSGTDPQNSPQTSNSCEVKVAQSCLILCNSKYCSLPGSSAHGILQARILEWATFSFSGGSS